MSDAGAEPATSGPPPRSRQSRRRSGQPRPTRGRLAVVAVVALVLVAAAVTDRTVGAPALPTPPPLADGVPVAPVGSFSSSAFCVGGGVGPDGVTATTIYLTNTGPRAVPGLMVAEVAPGTEGGQTGSGTPSPDTHLDLTVPAGATVAVDPARGLPAGILAATFAFAGGGIAVNQVVTGADGWSTAPCASQTSTSSSFAGGATAAGDALTLALLNPGSTQAVVNISFLTPAGVIAPSPYQGLAVPAGGIVSENVADYVQRQPEIATLVTAESGTVVAGQLQRWSTGGSGGIALRLGAPAPSTVWRFAQTTAEAHGTVTFHLANPGTTPVTATLAFGLPAATVVPLQVAVPAQSVVTFDASAAHRLPLGTPYATTVTAPAPIVVARSVQAPPGGPSPAWGASAGTASTATGWVVPAPGVAGAPGTAGAMVESLAVADPEAVPARVTVTVAATGAPVAAFTVAPGSLVVLGARLVGGLRALEVRADGPVVVEEDAGPAGAPGVVSSTGMPLPGRLGSG